MIEYRCMHEQRANREECDMRNYIEHRKQYLDCLNTQAMFNDVINEYDMAFQKTQPHSPCYSGMKPDIRINRAEEFVIEIESKNLKQRSEEARMILHLKTELLKMKEAELRKSFDIYDIVYVSRWIDNKPTKEIVRQVGYSSGQVYEIIKRIDKQIARD